MDRLHAVIPFAIVLALGTGCEKTESPEATSTKEPASKSRVNAVQAKEKVAESPEDFCDVYTPGADAKKFEYPELDGDAPPKAEGWRWVNLWATWCVPCIEEMPRLQKWEKEMAASGLGDVVFISADNGPEVLQKFATKHPDLPGVTGPRIADAANLTPWVEGLGLTGAALPVHIFVDPDDNIRCMRAGGVGENDRVTVESLLDG